jgi:hypothetical protein
MCSEELPQVAPYPSAWPVRYSHHCPSLYVTLASTNSAPPEAVDASPGSNILVSRSSGGLLRLSISFGCTEPFYRNLR